jgi:hypothetical protein
VTFALNVVVDAAERAQVAADNKLATKPQKVNAVMKLEAALRGFDIALAKYARAIRKAAKPAKVVGRPSPCVDTLLDW